MSFRKVPVKNTWDATSTLPHTSICSVWDYEALKKFGRVCARSYCATLESSSWLNRPDKNSFTERQCG